jgi:hypothetical protein
VEGAGVGESESGSNVNLTISGAEMHRTRNVQAQYCVVRVTSG